jgi:hypothetical protein
MTKFEAITQQLDNVTGGNYWSRLAYARAAWFNGHGGGFGPYAACGPSGCYPSYGPMYAPMRAPAWLGPVPGRWAYRGGFWR